MHHLKWFAFMGCQAHCHQYESDYENPKSTYQSSQYKWIPYHTILYQVSATSPSRWPTTLKYTCFSRKEISPIIVTSATTQALVLLIWENTSLLLLLVLSATTSENKHRLTHSGDKPFVWKQCNHSCTRAEGLKKHMLTNYREKPFLC